MHILVRIVRGLVLLTGGDHEAEVVMVLHNPVAMRVHKNVILMPGSVLAEMTMMVMLRRGWHGHPRANHHRDGKALDVHSQSLEWVKGGMPSPHKGRPLSATESRLSDSLFWKATSQRSGSWRRTNRHEDFTRRFSMNQIGLTRNL